MFKKGKVCDIDILNNHLLLQYSDRLSAFDKYVCDVPNKGKILAMTSRWWLERTQHIIPNHFICQDNNLMIVKKCDPILLEIVVRGYITGNSATSLWTHYSKGVRKYCGIAFPDGLIKNQKLSEPVVTPTTKSDDHDQLISPSEIIDSNILTFNEWQYIKEKALELYNFGVQLAQQRGLILVDTKYEFGKTSNGQIILIDELHTCDSSRYWELESYLRLHGQGMEPEKLDKDIVRDKLIKNEEISNELIETLSKTYKQFFNRLTNNNLVVILSGSEKDDWHTENIKQFLDQSKLKYNSHIFSAHKNTKELLDLLDYYNNSDMNIVFVTVAGRSNALSGVVACNTHFPVIACPPFKDKMDMMVNIQSTLQMPSNVPVMIILEPCNVVAAINRIMFH